MQTQSDLTLENELAGPKRPSPQAPPGFSLDIWYLQRDALQYSESLFGEDSQDLPRILQDNLLKKI